MINKKKLEKDRQSHENQQNTELANESLDIINSQPHPPENENLEASQSGDTEQTGLPIEELDGSVKISVGQSLAEEPTQWNYVRAGKLAFFLFPLGLILSGATSNVIFRFINNFIPWDWSGFTEGLLGAIINTSGVFGSASYSYIKNLGVYQGDGKSEGNRQIIEELSEYKEVANIEQAAGNQYIESNKEIPWIVLCLSGIYIGSYVIALLLENKKDDTAGIIKLVCYSIAYAMNLLQVFLILGNHEVTAANLRNIQLKASSELKRFQQKEMQDAQENLEKMGKTLLEKENNLSACQTQNKKLREEYKTLLNMFEDIVYDQDSPSIKIEFALGGQFNPEESKIKIKLNETKLGKLRCQFFNSAIYMNQTTFKKEYTLKDLEHIFNKALLYDEQREYKINSLLQKNGLKRAAASGEGNNCLLDSFFQEIQANLPHELTVRLGSKEDFIAYVRTQLDNTTGMLSINDPKEGKAIIVAIASYLRDKTGKEVSFDFSILVADNYGEIGIISDMPIHQPSSENALRLPIRIIFVNYNHYEPLFINNHNLNEQIYSALRNEKENSVSNKL